MAMWPGLGFGHIVKVGTRPQIDETSTLDKTSALVKSTEISLPSSRPTHISIHCVDHNSPIILRDQITSSSKSSTLHLRNFDMATKKKPLAPPLPTEYPPTTIHFPPPAPGTATKIGPQRTTKVTQKLKLLPEDKSTQLPGERDPVAQRDIERLFASKDRIAKFLPRVTAYCTASSYRMEGLMKFLQSRASTRTAAPQLFDEWFVPGLRG
jgi:hypothetical protein